MNYNDEEDEYGQDRLINILRKGLIKTVHREARITTIMLTTTALE